MILHVDVHAACHCYTKSWKDTPPISAFSLHSEYTICYLPPPSPPPAATAGGGGGVLLHVASSLQAYLRLALVHLGLQQWQQKVATGQVACHLRVRQHMHKPHTSVHTYVLAHRIRPLQGYTYACMYLLLLGALISTVKCLAINLCSSAKVTAHFTLCFPSMLH